ncbi:hypothetical protein CORC01_06024 [Colletotrichum orchidophilum]|uniref:Uncharacterized protein n=1 Tax=Colletotrichum orchidophilum TaxID=1209926 RepID=A0A1G4BBJ1_9PEZI|nr:uncharacterized protein CORC01_06024 [Colletotrichum orchidophilum]OHE98758.1 hypothetical protein CORC01_06024 [Colletotrichum orchidophilum]
MFLNSGAASANAWMCNCYYPNNPGEVVAIKVCNEFGGGLCHDNTYNINGCILDKPITDADCARLYPKIIDGKQTPDHDWKANCEHYTGTCPK